VTLNFIITEPKVLVEWLALPRTRNALGLNIGPQTGYFDSFLWFFSVPPDECLDITLNKATTASFTSFLIHHSPITLPFDGI
jgi:hypothetical protein